jgi:hypothetical protein
VKRKQGSHHFSENKEDTRLCRVEGWGMGVGDM